MEVEGESKPIPSTVGVQDLPPSTDTATPPLPRSFHFGLRVIFPLGKSCNPDQTDHILPLTLGSKTIQ